MPRYVAYSPTGNRIVGTLDTLSAVANMNGLYMYPGDPDHEFDFTGHTEVNWDSQITTLNADGELMFVDSEGAEWPKSSLVWWLDKDFQE